MQGSPPEYNKKENAKNLREGLENHIYIVAEKGCEKYGTIETIDTLNEFLKDNSVVRFPTLLEFDSSPQDAGIFARLEKPEDEATGHYTIFINPLLNGRDNDIINAALYIIVSINYGKIAKEFEAELFASQMLGVEKESYHARINKLREELS